MLARDTRPRWRRTRFACGEPSAPVRPAGFDVPPDRSMCERSSEAFADVVGAVGRTGSGACSVVLATRPICSPRSARTARGAPFRRRSNGTERSLPVARGSSGDEPRRPPRDEESPDSSPMVTSRFAICSLEGTLWSTRVFIRWGDTSFQSSSLFSRSTTMSVLSTRATMARRRRSVTAWSEISSSVARSFVDTCRGIE